MNIKLERRKSFRQDALEWVPESEWKTIIKKWEDENPDPRKWLIFYGFPQHHIFEYMASTLKVNGIAYSWDPSSIWMNEPELRIASFLPDSAYRFNEERNPNLVNNFEMYADMLYYDGIHVAIINEMERRKRRAATSSK